mgnify:CR=1 FL=1
MLHKIVDSLLLKDPRGRTTISNRLCNLHSLQFGMNHYPFEKKGYRVHILYKGNNAFSRNYHFRLFPISRGLLRQLLNEGATFNPNGAFLR